MSTAFAESGHAVADQSTSGQGSFPPSLSDLPVDELLALSSRYFRQLDRKHPVRDALVQYYAIARELETREAAS
ncbi:hypothetical protein [Arthrobacter sp. NPDC089319]|uniref:hypothetical protein n=1 Tax=Arthrobacter sp. NPDC089319 TaxID=3155915 RepID=UPI00342B643E